MGRQHNYDAINKMANDLIIDAIAPAAEMRTSYDQLKPTERAFVDAYVATDDPAQAIKAAYPAIADMSSKEARSAMQVRAVDMARRPMVQAAIAERMVATMTKWELTAEKVLKELAKVTFSNIDDYLDRTGPVPRFDFSEDRVSRDQMAAIGEFKVETAPDGTVRQSFKMLNKMDALDKAMKRLGLYAPEKIDLVGNIRHSDNNGGREVITIDMTVEQAAEAYSARLRDDD